MTVEEHAEAIKDVIGALLGGHITTDAALRRLAEIGQKWSDESPAVVSARRKLDALNREDEALAALLDDLQFPLVG